MATSKEYHDYIRECLSAAGSITTKKMMGEYCVYYRGKIIGSLCDNRFLVKQTPTSDRLLRECAMEYPYEGSRTLMYAVDSAEDQAVMRELLEGMYSELPDAPSPKTGLEVLPNIGKDTADQLRKAGILTPEQLKSAGAREAWLMLKKMDEGACLHLLTALEGAVQGVKKSELPPETRQALKEFAAQHSGKKKG